MNIVNMKIEDIHPYENNPRINDAAVEPVARSIQEFGFRVPIVIESENVAKFIYQRRTLGHS